MLGNLSRDQLDRYGEVHAVGAAWREVAETHPDLHIVANASDPHVVWAAQPANVTWVDARAPLALRRRDVPAVRRAARLDRRPVRVLRPATSCSPRPRTASTATTSCSTATRVPLQPRAARRRGTAGTPRSRSPRRRRTSGSIPIARGRRGRRPSTPSPAATCGCRCPTGATARVFLAKNPAGWSEVLRWVADAQVPTVIAVNARVADGKDPSWLWDVPYELLRGLPAAAAGERCLDVAVRLRYARRRAPRRAPTRCAPPPRSPATSPCCSCTYTQFSALYRRFGDGA